MHILRCRFNISCDISNGTFEISHKILNPYTAKYTIYWLLFLYVIYGIFELWRHKPSWDGPTLALRQSYNGFENYQTTVTEFIRNYMTFFCFREQISLKPELTHWGRDKMNNISQTTFSMKMFEFRLKFHWSLFPRVQLTIFQHWFR